MLILIVDYVDFTMILTKIGIVFEEGKGASNPNSFPYCQ